MNRKDALAAFTTERRKQKIRTVLENRQKDLTLVMNNIHDPHNVSAMLRSCDAFGIQNVHLLYTNESFPFLGKKSSASSKKWVDVFRHTNASKMAAELKSCGMRVLYAGLGQKSLSLTQVDFCLPTAVVLGNEHRGVDDELKRVSDGELHIPMQGMVQSFNVSVAAAIILYEAWRQRSASGLYESHSFSRTELENYYERWIRK
ncbi:MAG: TrmH family RNA methyltransferase [Thermodesulfobacteriota bacterium]